MMFNADKPISKSLDDILGRNEFAKSLADAIMAYETCESIVLGLYGKWGSGKSSLLNLVIEHLDKADYDCDSHPIIIRFNPWNISGQNQLLSQFFADMITNIPTIKNKKGKTVNLGELIQVYSLLLVATSLHPEIGYPALIAGKITEFFGKRLSLNKKTRNKYSDESLSSIKTKIHKELSQINRKIIIVIDDIDRLNKVEIRQIFQLTKAIADFPNTVYLLAFDRDIVVEALKGEQSNNGLEYLEKIVQIPFPIPEVEITKVYNLFFKKVNDIIGEIDDEDFDQKHWSKVFYNGISKYIHNVRDVVRVINIFSFKYSLIKNESNFIDLLGLIILEIYEPSIYSEIKLNKDLFVGNYKGLNEKKDESIISQLDSILDKSSYGKKEVVKDLLCELFPETGKIVDKWGRYSVDQNHTRKHSMICNSECFETYFKLTIGEKIVPRSIINNFLFECNQESIENLILQMNVEGKLDSFFDSIRALVQDMKGTDRINKRIPLLLLGLFKNWNNLDDPQINQFISVPFIWRLLFLSEGLLGIISDEGVRLEVMEGVLYNRDISLNLRITQLLSFERDHNRFTESSTSTNEQLFNLSNVVKMEDELYSEIVERSKGLMDYELLDVQFFWKEKNEEEMKTYFEKILETERGLVKFISSSVGIGKASGDFTYQIYTFHKKSFEEFYSVSQAFERVRIILDKNCTDEYSETEIKKVIAFTLSVSEDDFSSKPVTKVAKLYKEYLQKWSK